VPWPDMLVLARKIAAHKRVALFTNNGPLMKDSLPEVFPEAAEIFGADCYFSYEFSTKKPDPECYRRLVRHLGIAAGDAWFTDDKKSNVDGARMAGLKTHHFVSHQALRKEALQLHLIPA
jgi:HAD superfamily hydrolase (TIGR01509 family)